MKGGGYVRPAELVSFDLPIRSSFSEIVLRNTINTKEHRDREKRMIMTMALFAINAAIGLEGRPRGEYTTDMHEASIFYFTDY